MSNGLLWRPFVCVPRCLGEGEGQDVNLGVPGSQRDGILHSTAWIFECNTLCLLATLRLPAWCSHQ